MLLKTRAAAPATQANPAVRAANPVNQEARPALQIATRKSVNLLIAPALQGVRPPVSNPVAHLASALINKAPALRAAAGVNPAADRVRKAQAAHRKEPQAIEAAVGLAPATHSPGAQAAASQVKQEVRAALQSAATERLKAVALALPAANPAADRVRRAQAAHSRATPAVKAAAAGNPTPRVAVNK